MKTDREFIVRIREYYARFLVSTISVALFYSQRQQWATLAKSSTESTKAQTHIPEKDNRTDFRQHFTYEKWVAKLGLAR